MYQITHQQNIWTTKLLKNLLNNYRKLIGLLLGTSRPHDIASEEMIAWTRNRSIVLAAAAGTLARAFGIITALMSVALALNYLGSERFGMWITLSAFSSLLSLTDLGMGNSIITAVAKGGGRLDTEDMQKQISSAYLAMGSIGVLMLLVLISLYNVVPWAELFNVTDATARNEAGPSSAIFFVILALATPAGLVLRIQMGLQQGFRANLWQCAGSAGSLITLIAATRMEASLPILVLALAGTPVFINLVNTITFFYCSRPDLRPRLAKTSVAVTRQLSSDGGMFLTLQVCFALLFQVNFIIITQVLGAAAVATYAVPERLFTVVAVIMAIVLTPLWPAYGDAAARGDLAWIRQTFGRSLLVGVSCTAAMSTALLLSGPQLIHWWVGDAVHVPFNLLLGLAVWKVIEVIGSASAMLLNGVNDLRIQVLAALTCVALSIPLKLCWAEMFGVSGVIWATVVTYSLVVVPAMLIAVRKTLSP